MIDLFTADFDALKNEERYAAILDFARAQPTEGSKHDFKLTWTNTALEDVAAFANTFGGLLVIGVAKGQNDLEAKVVGVDSNSELTTRIASSIATNISPTPLYEIMECYNPDESGKRFCVIRVRSDARLYLVTKKAVRSPVWVRNIDQTVPADAAQLRGMIDREKLAAGIAQGSWSNRAHQLFEEMVIGQEYAAELGNWPAGNWKRSETHFKVALIPSESKAIPLDRRDERRFVALIHDNYRRVRSNLDRVAASAENRSADFYEYRWYHRNLDYEGRWRIGTSLDVAHATQVKEDDKWSLVDVVFYTILMLKIGAKWWEALNYFGDGVLSADLSVNDLQLARGRSGEFLGLFKPAHGDFGFRSEVVVVHTQQRPGAQAFVGVNFSTMRESIPATVTSLMNTLLRSLGHSLLLAEFEDNVRTIIEGVS